MQTKHELKQGWKHVEQAYFQSDPTRACFVETDTSVAGTPLWPQGDDFNPMSVLANLEAARDFLQPTGGHVFWGNVALNHDRSVPQSIKLLQQPERLTTTFVSGFLIPKTAIQDGREGFYLRGSQIPLLSDVVGEMKGNWLMSNLGYFMTPKLINPPEHGGATYSHNVRHAKAEHLEPTDNCHLGGFLVREADRTIQYPPIFQGGAVAILKDGTPHLMSKTALQGGRVRISGHELSWTADDVNPAEIGDRDVAIFNPTGTGPSSDWLTHRYMVGEGRFNIVVTNRGTGNCPVPVVGYAVQGECLQPAGCILISVRKPFAAKRGDDVQFDLDPWCDPEVFNQARYIYEGLLPIGTTSHVEFGPWKHPHGMLTQETFMFNAKQREPRAMLVQTERYFGAIAFSGRYELSLGISFSEMGPIADVLVKQMLPSERLGTMLNLDGGSASKLCWIQEGRAKPLTWVAPGPRNRMGDSNGNTYSCFFIKVNSSS